MRWGSIFTKKIKFFDVEKNENIKFLKMSSELLYKFRSSIIIMFRRKVDTQTFNFKRIIQYLKILIFSQKCFYIRWEAFLQGKSNFLTLQMIKVRNFRKRVHNCFKSSVAMK